MLTLVELGLTQQYYGEDLDVYMRRFHEKALDCCNIVDEEVLVNVCVHSMREEYNIFLENLSFTSFSKSLKQLATQINQCTGLQGQRCNQTQPHPMAQLAPKKRPIVTPLKNDRGSKPSNTKRSTFEKKKPKEYLDLPPFPCDQKKAAALLESWLKDFPSMDHFHSIAEQKTTKYYNYH